MLSNDHGLISHRLAPTGLLFPPLEPALRFCNRGCGFSLKELGRTLDRVATPRISCASHEALIRPLGAAGLASIQLS